MTWHILTEVGTFKPLAAEHGLVWGDCHRRGWLWDQRRPLLANLCQPRIHCCDLLLLLVTLLLVVQTTAPDVMVKFLILQKKHGCQCLQLRIHGALVMSCQWRYAMRPFCKAPAIAV